MGRNNLVQHMFTILRTNGRKRCQQFTRTLLTKAVTNAHENYTSQPVLLFSKYNNIIFGYFDSDNENKNIGELTDISAKKEALFIIAGNAQERYRYRDVGNAQEHSS